MANRRDFSSVNIYHVIQRTDTGQYLVDDNKQEWANSIEVAQEFKLLSLRDACLSGNFKTSYFDIPFNIRPFIKEENKHRELDESTKYYMPHIGYLKESCKGSNGTMERFDNQGNLIPYILKGLERGQYNVTSFWVKGQMCLTSIDNTTKRI